MSRGTLDLGTREAASLDMPSVRSSAGTTRDIAVTRSTRAWWELFGDDYDKGPSSRRPSLDGAGTPGTSSRGTDLSFRPGEDSVAAEAEEPSPTIPPQRRSLVAAFLDLFKPGAPEGTGAEGSDVPAPRVPVEALLDSSEEPTLKGWLTKKGAAFPWGFRRRWFVFWAGSCRLSYFETEEDATNGAAPKGSVVVRELSMHSSEPLGLIFQLTEERRNSNDAELVARAETEEEQVRWFKVVTSALRPPS